LEAGWSTETAWTFQGRKKYILSLSRKKITVPQPEEPSAWSLVGISFLSEIILKGFYYK
jgi:hypothetical protein